jgi:NADPH2:quinone reductase
MSMAVRVHTFGGPEMLRYEDIAVGEPKEGQVRLRQTAAGINYRDIYARNGQGGYAADQLPMGLGGEGVGIVEALGPGVTSLKPGDRVAYSLGALGSYAEARLMPAQSLVKVPHNISDETAAGMMVKGLTAHALIRGAYPVKAGDAILVHAAAGGLGLILCQWAKHLGATVIGTTSSEEKAALACANGCNHVILYTREAFAPKVKELTGGKGVAAIFDGVGKDTYHGDLDCLAVRGSLVGYGHTSGVFPPVDPLELMEKGSLIFQRISSRHFMTSRDELEMRANEIFDLVGRGIIKIRINQRYALKDAAQAHRDLEARKTTGSSIFVI